VKLSHQQSVALLFSELAQHTYSLVFNCIMSHPGFGRFWRQPESSDVVIVLLVGREDAVPVASEDGPMASAAESSDQVLQQFPGHTHLLMVSEYFEAQVRELHIISVTFPGEHMPFKNKHTLPPEAHDLCPAIWSQCVLYCT
jgi:hypothetical protein